MQVKYAVETGFCSPHLCVGFLFLVVHSRLPPPPAASLTPNLSTHNLLTHSLFTHTPSSHTTYSHTTYSHTTCSHTTDPPPSLFSFLPFPSHLHLSFATIETLIISLNENYINNFTYDFLRPRSCFGYYILRFGITFCQEPRF